MAFGIVTGAVLGGIASLLGGERANRANEANVNRQIDFQDMMSRTQYQRAVVDMKAAGLNPMLAYSQGGNAAPSGAAAVNQPVDLGPAVSTAVQARLAGAQVKNIEAQTKMTEVQTVGAAAEARVKAASAAQAERGLEDSLALLGFDRNMKELDYWHRAYKYGGSDGGGSHDRMIDLALGEYRAERAEQDWRAASRPEWIKRLPLETRRELAQALLQEFQVPGARRQAEVDESDYGAVRPYIKDGALGGSAAASAAMLDRAARLTAGRRRKPRGEREEPQKPGESRLRPPRDADPFYF